jgi:hypothetical protein
MTDIIIPIVFTEYKITVEIPAVEFDLFSWTELDNISIKESKEKVSNLGHAGILLIQSSTGKTKYYEYGRYDYPELKGAVRTFPVPNAKVSNGVISLPSLVPVLHKISNRAGKGSKIEGVFIEVKDSFSKLNNRAQTIKGQNKNPKRIPYSITSNSCIHFVKRLVEFAGKETPWMVDPRPNSYIGEFRDEYRDLDYTPKNRNLLIETMGKIQ